MATPKRAGRPRAQLPACYHQGFLEKRTSNDKMARKLWTSLCGNSLFFFNNSKDNDYIEKVDLSDFVSLSDDSSHDRNLEAARLQLHLKNGDIQLTAPSLEARELWKGYIFSVVKLDVPCSLNLLPGQLHMLREIVEKERVRRKPLPAPPAVPATSPQVLGTVTVVTPSAQATQNIYLPLLADMPVCYQQVSRAEAELILERNLEKGNLLLRPGRDGSSFAVTTRQDLNGPVFRHYLVTRRHEGGFAIAVENPILCETLHDVISCLVEKTGGSLKPLVLEEAYEENITFVDNNKESGEKIIRSAGSSPVPPLPVAPKPGPRATVLGPQPACDPDDGIYLIPSDEEVDESDEDSVIPPAVVPVVPVRQLPHQHSVPDGLKLGSGGALLPPSHPPKPRPRTHTMPVVPVPQVHISLTEELRKKLQKRQAISK